MNYQFYIQYFMTEAIERGNRNLPALNQLYATTVPPGLLKWCEELKAVGRLNPFGGEYDPRFAAVNYRGDHQQDAAHAMLVEELRELRGERFLKRLSRLITVEKVLPEEVALKHFGSEVVERALATPSGFMAYVAPEIENYAGTLRACLGYVVEGKRECAVCAFQAECKEVAARVAAEVQARYGTDDPKAALLREQARKRKQRQRERERAGIEMTDQEKRRILSEAGDAKKVGRRVAAKVRRDAKKTGT